MKIPIKDLNQIKYENFEFCHMPNYKTQNLLFLNIKSNHQHSYVIQHSNENILYTVQYSSGLVCCDKIPGKKQVMGGDTYFDLWYNKGYSLSQQSKHGDRS